MIIEITLEEYRELHPDLNSRTGNWEKLIFTKTVENSNVLEIRRWIKTEDNIRSIQSYVMPEYRGKAKRLIENGIQYWIDQGFNVILTGPIDKVKSILSIKPKYNYIKNEKEWIIKS